MVECPKCGYDVKEPIKTWPLAPRGRKPIIIGQFKCPRCGTSFKRAVKK